MYPESQDSQFWFVGGRHLYGTGSPFEQPHGDGSWVVVVLSVVDRVRKTEIETRDMARVPHDTPRPPKKLPPKPPTFETPNAREPPIFTLFLAVFSTKFHENEVFLEKPPKVLFFNVFNYLKMFYAFRNPVLNFRKGFFLISTLCFGSGSGFCGSGSLSRSSSLRRSSGLRRSSSPSP